MSKLSNFIEELKNGKEIQYGSKDYYFAVNEWCLLDLCKNDDSFSKFERFKFLEQMQILHTAFSNSELKEFQ